MNPKAILLINSKRNQIVSFKINYKKNHNEVALFYFSIFHKFKRILELCQIIYLKVIK
jgi:hypothetical protein